MSAAPPAADSGDAPAADPGDAPAADDAADDSRRRLTTTYTVDDKAILDNGANKNSQPSKIKLCYGAHVDSA